MLVTIVLLVVGTRYRLPLLPGLIALAGAGIAAIVDEVRARRWRDVAMLAAIAVVVWALAHARTDAASRNLAEEWAMTGLSLLQESRLEEAENAYRRAIAMDESSFAWDGLGLVLQRRELRTHAREAFERAVADQSAERRGVAAPGAVVRVPRKSCRRRRRLSAGAQHHAATDRDAGDSRCRPATLQNPVTPASMRSRQGAPRQDVPVPPGKKCPLPTLLTLVRRSCLHRRHGGNR